MTPTDFLVTNLWSQRCSEEYCLLTCDVLLFGKALTLHGVANKHSVIRMRSCENHKIFEDTVPKNNLITLNCVSCIYFSLTVTFILNMFTAKFKAMYSTLLVKIELVALHISFEVKNSILNFFIFRFSICRYVLYSPSTRAVATCFFQYLLWRLWTESLEKLKLC